MWYWYASNVWSVPKDIKRVEEIALMPENNGNLRLKASWPRKRECQREKTCLTPCIDAVKLLTPY